MGRRNYSKDMFYLWILWILGLTCAGPQLVPTECVSGKLKYLLRGDEWAALGRWQKSKPHQLHFGDPFLDPVHSSSFISPSVTCSILCFSIHSSSEHVEKDYVQCWRIRADEGREEREWKLENLLIVRCLAAHFRDLLSVDTLQGTQKIKYYPRFIDEEIEALKGSLDSVSWLGADMERGYLSLPSTSTPMPSDTHIDVQGDDLVFEQELTIFRLVSKSF